MLKAILFDLDGTLLDLDMDVFLSKYLELVSSDFTDLLPPKELVKALMDSTSMMISDKTQKTNQEVFINDFTKKLQTPSAELMPRFDDFYVRRFPLLKSVVKPNPAARQIVEMALRNNVDVVIATNPVFPQAAIRARLRWAELDDIEFKLITTYEVMHSCKPNLEYYEEVLNLIGRKSDECLMVGNDVEEDMVASRLGIKTYLAEDCLIDRGSGFEPDFRGPLKELCDVLRSSFNLQ